MYFFEVMAHPNSLNSIFLLLVAPKNANKPSPLCRFFLINLGRFSSQNKNVLNVQIDPSFMQDKQLTFRQLLRRLPLRQHPAPVHWDQNWAWGIWRTSGAPRGPQSGSAGLTGCTRLSCPWEEEGRNSSQQFQRAPENSEKNIILEQNWPFWSA